MAVRRLGGEDIEVLREVRLRALQDAPDAFWTTYEREVAYGPAEWHRWIDGAALFVAEYGASAPCGMAGGMADGEDPAGALLVSMWVAPEHRGSGLADRLVAAVAAWAVAEGRQRLRLHVEQHNHRARRCYQRLGFRLTGRRLFRERDGRFELEMEAEVSPS